eukprot:gene8294-17689_t
MPKLRDLTVTASWGMSAPKLAHPQPAGTTAIHQFRLLAGKKNDHYSKILLLQRDRDREIEINKS